MRIPYHDPEDYDPPPYTRPASVYLFWLAMALFCLGFWVLAGFGAYHLYTRLGA